MPDGKELPHPVLIISSDSSNSYENYYTGVMMSATQHIDRFSFKCENNMFESPLEKTGCQYRLYIIVGFKETDVSTFKNRMKKIFLKLLINQVKENIFFV